MSPISLTRNDRHELIESLLSIPQLVDLSLSGSGQGLRTHQLCEAMLQYRQSAQPLQEMTKIAQKDCEKDVQFK